MKNKITTLILIPAFFVAPQLMTSQEEEIRMELQNYFNYGLRYEVFSGSPTLSAGHIGWLEEFILKLKQPTDAIFKYLKSKLTQSTRQQLEYYDDSDPNVAAFVAAMEQPLIEFLNSIIQGPSIYDAQRFKGVSLRLETMSLLEKNPQGEIVHRLNRLLIEDAYPHIRRNRSSSGARNFVVDLSYDLKTWTPRAYIVSTKLIRSLVIDRTFPRNTKKVFLRARKSIKTPQDLKQDWLSHKIKNYKFSYHHVGSSPTPFHALGGIVTVKNGKIAKVDHVGFFS